MLRTDKHIPSATKNFIGPVNTCSIYRSYWQSSGIKCMIFHHHHHHHHVREGLGVFPFPWSSRWSWSLHRFLGRPMLLRPFGLYCSACFEF